MNLGNCTLDVWLKDAPKECYKREQIIDYYTHYKKLEEYLLENVHKEVTVGAHLENQDELLNDHGPDHIKKVIEKATELVECNTCKLNPLEVYLLLSAIQLHDVGNMLGREGHEVNLQEIMRQAGEACGRDEFERILLRKIAEAHGGKVRGLRDERDTIGQLEPTEPHHENVARPRFLASILRFADELSDDKSRAYKSLLEKDKIPKRSQVFHAYASCLETVEIKHEENSVELHFFIPKDFTLKKFGKLGEEIYLLDEIYNRAMKMNLERIYCMRFCKKLIDIEKIVVKIEFYASYADEELFPTINFTLCDSGYPEAHKEGIYGLCGSLLDSNGNKINGKYVKSKIVGKTGSISAKSKKLIQKIKRVFK